MKLQTIKKKDAELDMMLRVDRIVQTKEIINEINSNIKTSNILGWISTSFLCLMLMIILGISFIGASAVLVLAGFGLLIYYVIKIIVFLFLISIFCVLVKFLIAHKLINLQRRLKEL